MLVLSFVGSTGSTTISFILPGLFYWKVCSYVNAVLQPRALTLIPAYSQ